MHFKIIYKEQNGEKTENNLRKYIRKKGIWALFGKQKENVYECLQIGKCKDVGSEILYDISCLNNLSYDPSGTKNYINEFGIDTGLKYNEGIVQEYLYPYIKKQDYKVLLFAYVYDTNDEEKEKLLAWLTHAKYWRDSHKPLEREIPDRYEKIKISKIDSRKDCSVWITEDAIMNFLMDIT